MNLFKEWIDLFFPKICVHCGLFENKFLCRTCRDMLNQTVPESFISRNRSIDWQIEQSHRSLTNLEKVFYFYEYNKVIHSLIEAIKYKSHREAVNEFVDLILEADEFKKVNFDEFDLLTYIPTHDKKLSQRKFNHTELIVDNISKRLNIPYLRILNKVKNTKAQADLARQDRLTNLRNAFEIRTNLPIEIKDQRILILDDICTTGSTLEESAKTIKQTYPNVSIYAFTLARGSL